MDVSLPCVWVCCFSLLFILCVADPVCVVIYFFLQALEGRHYKRCHMHL